MLKFLCKLVNLTGSYKRKHKGMFFSEHTVDREDWSTQLLHSSPFYPTTQNPMLYNALLIGKVALLVQASTSPCKTCSLDPPVSASKTASRSVQLFLHSSQERVPVLYNVR